MVAPPWTSVSFGDGIPGAKVIRTDRSKEAPKTLFP
jgi:hypothetical protein